LTAADFPPRVRLDIAYRGDAFHGWQVQPGLRTVQGEIGACLERLLRRSCLPIGAGRTDTGVHARGQVAHVKLHDTAEVARVVKALAGMMPDDILVRGARQVSPAFDARRCAVSRRYAYTLLLAPDLFRPFAYHVPWPLDQAAMDAACGPLLGVHDFTSFCRTASLRDDNHCQLDVCRFEWGADWGIFHVQANRFLHNMVRNLVGVLVEVGRGRREPADLAVVLAARDRRAAGMRAPAHGLCLEEVGYPAAFDDPGYVPPGFTAAAAATDEGVSA
jgi:tRNA pseudouridine38-40 synthase